MKLVQKIITYKVTSIALVIVLFLTILTAGFLFFHFDYTDEGLYIYLLTQHQAATFLSPFYTLYHFWGDIFGQTVLAYRFLTLLSLIAVSAFLAWSTYRFLFSKKYSSKLLLFVALVVIASFSQYTMIAATFSYNSAAVIAASLWVGSLLLMIEPIEGKSKLTRVGAILLAISLLIAITARPPFGVLLILLTTLILFVTHYFVGRRFSGFDRVLFFALTLFLFYTYYFFNHDLIARLLVIYPAHLQSSHQNVVVHSFLSLQRIFASHWYLFIASVAMYSVFRQPFLSKKAWHLFITFIVVLFAIPLVSAILDRSAALKALRTGGFFLTASIIIIGFYFFRFKDFVQEKREDVFVMIIAITAAVASSFGTNLELINNIPITLLIAPLLIAVGRYTDDFAKNTKSIVRGVLLLGLFATVIVVNGQYFPHSRSGSFSKQQYLSQSKILQGVFVEEEFGVAVDTIQSLLTSKNFDFDRDRLMAYPNMPGIIAAVGAKAFGYSMTMPTDHLNADAVNCAYVDLEPIGEVKDVYFLLGEQLSDEYTSCLNAHLTKDINIQTYSIGELYDYQSAKHYSLKLVGPYHYTAGVVER